MATNDGGPAFPRPMHFHADGGPESYWSDAGSCGMSLRDWFAGQALAGMLSAQHVDAGEMGAVNANAAVRSGTSTIGKDYAESAYALADAMLATRDRSPQ